MTSQSAVVLLHAVPAGQVGGQLGPAPQPLTGTQTNTCVPLSEVAGWQVEFAAHGAASQRGTQVSEPPTCTQALPAPQSAVCTQGWQVLSPASGVTLASTSAPGGVGQPASHNNKGNI